MSSWGGSTSIRQQDAVVVHFSKAFGSLKGSAGLVVVQLLHQAFT